MATASPKPKYTYIYDLPYSPQRELALILDDNNQWKELGDNMQYTVTRLNEFGRTSSPTMAMFADWGQRNHTIVELFILLSKMQHYRALEKLMPYVEEKYHTLFRKGELNLTKLLKKEIDGAAAGGQTPIESNSPSPGACALPKPPYDSCNLNSPGNERAFPPKLASFVVGQPLPMSIPVPINAGDMTRSENTQSLWNAPSPVRAPLPSPQQHGPVNGALPRRDSESSSFSDASSASAMSNIPPIDEQELTMATNYWDATFVLGKGGFGTVYKGTWKNTHVAIKRMENKGLTGANFPMQQSMGELRILNAVRHDNILPLYGYSLGGDFPCLVYQFMPNGSLEDRLLCRQGTYPLNWEQRFNIARGTARGLQFLHTMGDKPLIHGDIKSANILLDKNFEPKIGDFGLAREGPQTHYTHIKVSRVLGTRPYLPDEYLRGKQISTKVDTYSFGIVLFELATGLRAYDGHREYPYLRDLIENSGQSDLRDVKAGQACIALYQPLVHVGRWCAATKAKERPEMVKVLQNLDYLDSENKGPMRHPAHPIQPPNPGPTPIHVQQPALGKTKDKQVPFLNPSHAVQPERVTEPAPVPVPQMHHLQSPMEVARPVLVPTVVEEKTEDEIIPAFHELSMSGAICSVQSAEIPNFDSLLKADSTSHSTSQYQRSCSDTEGSSDECSDSDDETKSNIRHSGTTAQKEIPSFSPN